MVLAMKFKRIFVVLLSLALLLPLGALPAQAESPALLRVAVLADTHFFSPSLSGDYGQAFQDSNINGQLIEQAPGILRSALAAIAARAKAGEVDYLLMAGDITNTAEYISHRELAGILEEFEAESGVQVVVVPGNHDINYSARDYSSGTRQDAKRTTPADFFEIYRNLGYDLPNMAMYATPSDDTPGSLSYAVDLACSYRLIAIDTHRRRIDPELRAWVVEQIAAAKAAGKTVVGLGHHPLTETLRGQMIFMQNQGIENKREIAEEFADAGMHFYFSGHMHTSEISPWVSDRGETLFDIASAGLFTFPGDYRVVEFSSAGGRIEADIRSFPYDEILPVTANGITYPQPFHAQSLYLTFGGSGEVLADFLMDAVQQALRAQLESLPLIQAEPVLDTIGRLLKEAFAQPASALPSTRFISELGFGDPGKPGTLGDAGLSLLAYMFWNKHDVAEDPFMLDVLRRMQNGDLVRDLLDFAVPMLLGTLGAELVPILTGVDCCLINRAFELALGSLSCPVLALLGLFPALTGTISNTLYSVASGLVVSQSPTGSRDGVIAYDGPADVPTGHGTYRLPYDLNASLSRDLRNAEITWYSKPSLTSPALRLNDESVAISISTEEVAVLVDELDLFFMRMLGTSLRLNKHTATLSGLAPGSSYQFTAGDSAFGWWSEEQSFRASHVSR